MRPHFVALVLLAACSSDPAPRDGATADDVGDAVVVLDAPDAGPLDTGDADAGSDAAPDASPTTDAVADVPEPLDAPKDGAALDVTDAGADVADVPSTPDATDAAGGLDVPDVAPGPVDTGADVHDAPDVPDVPDVAPCPEGRGDCDGNATNGCETDTRATAAHCGGCGMACPARPHTALSCFAGTCIFTCDVGFANCDGGDASGCEIDTRTDLAHCGGCNRPCALANASGICTAGACAVAACAAGFGDCDRNPANGCEVDTRSSASNCGGCGMTCPARPSATAACVAGGCAYTCAAGRGDCDGNPANGCETDTTTSTVHCGACGACQGRPNTVTTCRPEGCRYACAAGFGDCDGNATNGCETDVRTELFNCGACGNACTLLGSTNACANGLCVVVACFDATGDCDGNSANGCETNLRTGNPSRCGTCSTVCPAPPSGGVALCVDSATCSTSSLTCPATMGDCDGRGSNGCETPLYTTSNCGACGRSCGAAFATSSCAGGACSFVCRAGYGDCDGNRSTGCETDTRTNAAHCGACGNACSAGRVCRSSVCAVQ